MAVCQECPDFQDHPVVMDTQEKRETEEILEMLDHVDHLERLDPQETQESEALDQKEILETLVRWDRPVRQAQSPPPCPREPLSVLRET